MTRYKSCSFGYTFSTITFIYLVNIVFFKVIEQKSFNIIMLVIALKEIFPLLLLLIIIFYFIPNIFHYSKIFLSENKIIFKNIYLFQKEIAYEDILEIKKRFTKFSWTILLKSKKRIYINCFGNKERSKRDLFISEIMKKYKENTGEDLICDDSPLKG